MRGRFSTANELIARTASGRSSAYRVALQVLFDDIICRMPERAPLTEAPPVMKRTLPSCQLRRVLWWPEFDRDVVLSRDRPPVQQSGRVTPLANGFNGGGKKRGGAAQELDLLHLAKLPDHGADFYGFRHSMVISRVGVTRPTEGNQLAGFQPSRSTSH